MVRADNELAALLSRKSMASSFGWPSFEIKISNLANFALLLHPVMGCLSHHGTESIHREREGQRARERERLVQ